MRHPGGEPRDDGRTVDPTREHGTDGQLCPLAYGDGLVQPFEKFARGIVPAQPSLGRVNRRKRPIAGGREDFASRLFDVDGMGGRQTRHTVEGGGADCGMPERQVVADRLRVDPAGKPGEGAERFRLRSEDEGAIGAGVNQRLLAETVAGEEQAILLRVPDGEGEHATQPPGQVCTPLAISVQQDFAVAARAEDVALSFETAAEFGEVVDLTVVGDGEATVRTDHRLGRGIPTVQYGKPGMGQSDAVALPDALPVRPPMRKTCPHGFEDGAHLPGGEPARRHENAGYAAHDKRVTGDALMRGWWDAGMKFPQEGAGNHVSSGRGVPAKGHLQSATGGAGAGGRQAFRGLHRAIRRICDPPRPAPGLRTGPREAVDRDGRRHGRG